MIKTPLSTMIGGAFWTPGATILGSTSATLDTIIKSLFANSEQGFAYDPNDLTTLYQDAAGNIPVTAAGQPVGLMLDKSKGLSLSAELFTAALDFNNWSRTVAVTSVTANSFTTNGFGGCIKNPITTGMSLTKTYQVRIFGTCNVAHKIRSSSTYVGEVSVPAGAFDVTIKSPITFADSSMYFQLQAAGTITVNSISIKELAGNHTYQTVSASRPSLQRNATTGAYYLAFDGVDDFLQTNSIDFTATDKVSLFAGVRKLSDVATGVVCEFGANVDVTNGTFSIMAPALAGTAKFRIGVRGSVLRSVETTAIEYSAPMSAVVMSNVSLQTPLVELRVNSKSLQKSTADLGGGNLSSNSLYLGRRVGGNLPFNGNIYSLIGISRLTTDSETIALEKAIAKNTGVTLNV